MKLEKYRNKLQRKKETKKRNKIKHYKTYRGVYCMELIKDGVINYYIGSSVDTPNRIKQHIKTTLPLKYPEYTLHRWYNVILVKNNDDYPYNYKGFLFWLETKVWLEFYQEHKDKVLNKFPMMRCSNVNISYKKK